jgi:asparagine synthase (glutamine-hydrolysing)
MNLLPSALAGMDQPTVDGINTFVVAHAAREAGLKVALSGIGGDEIFGGYSSFKDVPAVARFKKLHLPTSAASSMLYDSAPSARKIAKISEGLDAPDDVASIWLARRRIFSSRQMKDILRTQPEDRSNWFSGVSQQRLSQLRKISAGLNLGDAVSRLELNGYTEPMLLRDGDFMGMANSLEIRAPFLDLNFSRLALQVPADKRLSRVTPKHYFVQTLGDSLSTTVTSRAKQGFVLPFERWMLAGMKASVDTAIQQLASVCPILDANACHQIWDDFQRSPRNVGWVRPWSLFVLSNFLAEHRLEVHNYAVQLPDSSATAHP